jgi:hypothetical protein
MKKYKSDFEEVLDLRAYVIQDISNHSFLKDALRREKLYARIGSANIAEMYAHVAGQMAGYIFRNREVAMEQYCSLSQGKF